MASDYEILGKPYTIESLGKESLQMELENQAKRYTKFGFPKRLKISQGRFKDMIMGLTVPQPEAYKGKFDIPVIVIGAQIPVLEQYKIINYNYYLDNLLIHTSEYPSKYQTPNVLHLVWMQDGKKNLGKSVDKVRAVFHENERGANLYDGVGLIIARPNVLKDHFIDLPGTDIGYNRAPYLYLSHDKQEVSDGLTSITDLRFGSASGGK